MSNVPLPRPGPLGLIQYAGVDMQEYAAAVSAAKDAEISRLKHRIALHDPCNGRMAGEPPRYTPECVVLRAEVAGLQIKADLFDLAVRKGLLSVHSELIDPRNHGTRVSWMQGHDKACDISNDAAAHGIAASPAAPAAPVAREPRHVRKVGGSFQHTGTVVAEFRTAAGEPRIVLEFDAPVTGMLHVYRPDQVEPCEPVAPAATSAAPAVPLTDEQLAKIAVEDEFLLYCDQESFNEIARAIEAAHGIGGSNG